VKLHKKLALLCLPLVLTACTTTQITGEKPQPVAKPQPTVQTKPALVAEVAQAPDAVTALLARAEQQQRNGNNSAAAVSLERAIRIAPRYPESYYLLGKLRFAQGSYNQAQALAQKAISLGATGWLLRQAQKLIKQSLEY